MPLWLSGKESACNAGDKQRWVWSLGWEDTLQEEMATHSSILAWEIPWTEKPGGLQSTGSQRVGHDWIATEYTHTHTHTHTCHGEQNPSSVILWWTSDCLVMLVHTNSKMFIKAFQVVDNKAKNTNQSYRGIRYGGNKEISFQISRIHFWLFY